MSTFRLKGASGPVINQAFTLGERTVIGRADDCDLRLDQDGVAGRHAVIEHRDGGLQLTGLDAAHPVLLNGEAVQSAALGSGDEILLGTCRFVLQAPGLRPERVLTGEAVRPRRSNLPWLIVVALLAAAALSWQRGWLPF
jgi:pSer/pThr/pTyr-binding forkhead associated (FHA) protein